MSKKKNVKTPQQIWEGVSSVSVHFVESIFFSLGIFVAKHPWQVIFGTLLFVTVSCIGLIRFHIEKNPMNLWVPPDSDFYHDTNWYIKTFGTGLRLQNIIFTANDVLHPDVLIEINDITEKISALNVKYENQSISLTDLCYKVPVVNFFGSNFNTGSIKTSDKTNNSANSDYSDSVFEDPTLWVDSEFYCSFLEEFELTCLQYNLLDIWKNDLNIISSLNKHDIIAKVNSIKVNPVSGHPFDYTKILGGLEYDDKGKIISAKSVLLTFYTKVNMSEVNLDDVGNLVGTEDWVTVPLASWEKQFLEALTSISLNTKSVKIFYEAGRSFADVSGESMFHDLDKLFLGILLMFVYVQFGLSRFNWLEIRLTLGSVGLLCVGLAYVSAVSWCSIVGIPFGPVHSSLPFLLMGLGIDDMFVMKACWKNLSESEAKKSLPVKIGLMLKHAGVSIVITSFTDIVALLIGAITILPSLKSFCLYAATGVFFIFCFSVTFYVAVFTLDVIRIENNCNGLIFCYQHKNQIQISTKKTFLRNIFEFVYRNIIFTIPGKIIVILFTIVITGFSIQAVFKLEQRFDPKWFIPDDTYYKQYLDTHDHYYPENGNDAMVFLGKLNYRKEFPNLCKMMESIGNKSYVSEAMTSIEYLHKYVLINYNTDLKNTSTVTDFEFYQYLSRFLFSPVGGKFQANFKFSEPLSCGVAAPRILATSIPFKFTKFHGPEEYIPAMHEVKNIVKTASIAGDVYRSVWSRVFGNWVTDEVIANEVERNIELALICVMVCTIILITNLQMCFWIFICVSLTILNVLGWMQRWGMTVDIVCCIGLELAIGLCVDYAAHVGHTFLTIQDGSRHERAYKTVTSIGTAVLLGGGSTLLSLSLLSMSKAYTFQSFFKIFLLVILFGLFNGLIFLPVVLSLIGPGSYKIKDHTVDCQSHQYELNEKQTDDGLHTN